MYIDYADYCRLYEKGIVEMLQKNGKSGVVSWIIPDGCLDVLCNRKEGVVGVMLKENHQKLLRERNDS